MAAVWDVRSQASAVGGLAQPLWRIPILRDVERVAGPLSWEGPWASPVYFKCPANIRIASGDSVGWLTNHRFRQLRFRVRRALPPAVLDVSISDQPAMPTKAPRRPIWSRSRPQAATLPGRTRRP